MLAAMGIVFPPECNFAVVKTNQAMIGDGDPVRVAGQIMEDMLRSTKRPFGIDDPVLAEQRAQEGAKGFLLRQRFQGAR